MKSERKNVGWKRMTKLKEFKAPKRPKIRVYSDDKGFFFYPDQVFDSKINVEMWEGYNREMEIIEEECLNRERFEEDAGPGDEFWDDEADE